MVPSEDDRAAPGAPAPSPAGAPDRGGRKLPSRRRRRLIILIGFIVLLAAIVVGAYYYWRSRYYQSTNDAYVEGHPVVISARAAGNIVRVYVQDNQHVPQDTLLVEIDPRDYQIALARAEAALQSAQADEQKAAADVEAARAEWTKMEQDWHRNEELVKQGAVTPQTAEHSRADATAARANLDAKQRTLASDHAKTVGAQAAVDDAQLRLSYAKVVAPQAGYVTQKSAEVGAYINVGQALLVIVPDDMYVTANFKETQLTLMRPGQPARITVDTYPGVVFAAHVDSIQAGTGPVFSLFPPENATGNFVKIVQRVPVKVVFNEPPDPNHRLVLGMSVEARVRVRNTQD